MKANITPLHDDAYSCMEDLIYSLCVWQDTDFHAMFASSWNFEWEAFDHHRPLSLAKRIGTGNKEWNKLLSVYHGVNISEQVNNLTANEFIQGIKDNTLKLPIIIAFDYYYCPWSKDFYYKFHGGGGGLPHTCLITSIETDGFLCIDPLFSKNIEFLPLNHFLRGYEGYRTVSFNSYEYTKFDCNWLELIRYGVSKSLSSNLINNLSSLEDEIVDLDLALETQGFENRPGLSPIMYQLKLIGMGRKKFSKILFRTYLQTNQEQFNIFSKDVYELGSNWDNLSNTMMKAFYSKQPQRVLNKLPSKISEIKKQESDKLTEISFYVRENSLSKG